MSRVCAAAVLALGLLSSCVGEIDGVAPGDGEAPVVALQGDALSSELMDSPVRRTEAPFVRVGVVWDADQPGAIEMSTSVDGVLWSAWRAPDVTHEEVEQQTTFAGQWNIDGEAARFYRLRAGTGSATFVRLELLDAPLAEAEEPGDGTETMYSFSVGGIEVHSRAEWGARSTRCSTKLGQAYRMAIHHTETPTNDSISPEARLRQIQSYHMDVRGWCDIGYHYLISRDGRVWEGRPGQLLGAHAGAGNNTGNIGIALIGSYDDTPITEAQLQSVAGLVRALAGDYGITIDRTTIKGHREYKSTSCPGDALFAQLDEIVNRARSGDSGGGDTGGGDTGGGDTGGSTSCGGPLATDGPWSCGGLAGASTNADGVYYTTSFGCWVDDGGTAHSDGGDDCNPACSASSIGCTGLSGPECERSINWYMAGADRFACGARVLATNPDNGRAAVLKVIDRGPSCYIENTVDYWVADLSYRASYYLFDGPTSATEHADVTLEVVPAGTPLGPIGGAVVCDGTPPPATGNAGLQGVIYRTSDPSQRIAGATVSLSTGQEVTADAHGYYTLGNLPAGPVTITASAAGYPTQSVTRTLSDGTTEWGSVRLE